MDQWEVELLGKRLEALCLAYSKAQTQQDAAYFMDRIVELNNKLGSY